MQYLLWMLQKFCLHSKWARVKKPEESQHHNDGTRHKKDQEISEKSNKYDGMERTFISGDNEWDLNASRIWSQDLGEVTERKWIPLFLLKGNIFWYFLSWICPNLNKDPCPSWYVYTVLSSHPVHLSLEICINFSKVPGSSSCQPVSTASSSIACHCDYKNTTSYVAMLRWLTEPRTYVVTELNLEI